MKVKKQWAKKEVAPRESAEIEKEYNMLCATLGGTAFQMESLDQRRKALLNRIGELVQENTRRVELDKKAKKETLSVDFVKS
jgi:hypothetical protein